MVKETLAAQPVNRNKDPRTRGKSLAELAAMTGLRTLHLRTINKYLQTYNGLFSWAKQNGYCRENPFAGLSLRAEKANLEAPRLPFKADDLDKIRRSLLTGDRSTQAHHKWGALIGLYTGARLNEVAPLHLTDIREIDGVWCFDINAEGPTKKLKNTSSKRIVPLHPKLIHAGLLAYVAEMRNIPGNQRLFPQFSYTVSDGYGRNLGRWFNEALLPELGIKASSLPFTACGTP